MAFVTCPSCGLQYHLRLMDPEQDRTQEALPCLDCWKDLVDLEYYARELGRISEVSIRGSGESSFLYARSNVGAVELSSSKSGLWIEFWKGDKDVSEKDETVYTRYEALLHATRWLLHGAA